MTTASLPNDRMLAVDASTMSIDHAAVDSEDVLQGLPTTGTVPLVAAAGVELGVWEITPGTVTEIEADELFIVLSGRGQVEFEDGSTLPLGAGTVGRVRAGDRTRWIIHETLRKIYVVLPIQKDEEAT